MLSSWVAPTILTGHGIKVTRVRELIKQAAGAGGSYHVQVDMRGPTPGEAAELVMMAGGATTKSIAAMHTRIRETMAAHYRYGRRSAARYDERANSIRQHGPHRLFKPFPEYEQAMAAWAERVKR